MFENVSVLVIKNVIQNLTWKNTEYWHKRFTGQNESHSNSFLLFLILKVPRNKHCQTIYFIILKFPKMHYFFSVRVFFHRYWRFTGQQTKREGRLYSSLSFSHTCGRSEINLKLCKWDGNDVFLIAPFATIRLLCDEIFHLLELLFGWLKIKC